MGIRNNIITVLYSRVYIVNSSNSSIGVLDDKALSDIFQDDKSHGKSSAFKYSPWVKDTQHKGTEKAKLTG